MTQMLHTPGPWIQGTDPRQIESANEGTIICTVSGALSNDGVLKDARLIAAAPELLEMLRACWDLGIDRTLVPKVSAAIAKATGAHHAP